MDVDTFHGWPNGWTAMRFAFPKMQEKIKELEERIKKLEDKA